MLNKVKICIVRPLIYSEITLVENSLRDSRNSQGGLNQTGAWNQEPLAAKIKVGTILGGKFIFSILVGHSGTRGSLSKGTIKTAPVDIFGVFSDKPGWKRRGKQRNRLGDTKQTC